MEQAYEIIGVFYWSFSLFQLLLMTVCVGYCLSQKRHQFCIVKQFIQAEPFYQKGDNECIKIYNPAADIQFN